MMKKRTEDEMDQDPEDKHLELEKVERKKLTGLSFESVCRCFKSDFFPIYILFIVLIVISRPLVRVL
jgi:hypothetical protein